MSRILRAAIAVAAAAVSFASALEAQSLTAGGITGVVRDATARVLPEVSISLTARATGVLRTRMTPRDGSYDFNLLLPGDYDVLVERFGYRPRLIEAVPVRAGAPVRLDLVLSEGGGGIDTIIYSGVPTGGVRLGLAGGGADDQFAALADVAGLATGIASLLPGADRELDAQGLPGRMGALALDGMPRWSARHSRLASAWLDGIAFPGAAVHSVELVSGTDAELPGSGGGFLGASSSSGAGRLSAVVTAAAGIDGQSASLKFGGPAVRDTAHFVLGLSVARLNPELPAPWPDSLGAGAAAIAQDSFQTDLSAYLQAYKPQTTILSGFGRFDWIVARDHRLSVRGDVATATLDDPLLAWDVPAALGSRLAARDVSAAVLVTSTFGQRLGNELRAAIDIGKRDYTGTGMAGTGFVDGGFSAGTPDVLPGSFGRTTFRISETLHYRVPFGVLKGGFQLSLSSFDHTYADGRAGRFLFGDSLGFAGLSGAFVQTVGTAPLAAFKTTTIGGFVQALVRPTASLEVLAGVRLDQEMIPVDQIRLNDEWRRLTGIDNRTVDTRSGAVAPRFAFTWTPDAARRWQIGGEAGRFLESSDPGELSEAITHATGQSVRRAFGGLGRWPLAPDSTVAPVRGQTLTLLGSHYAPPISSRLLFGITGNVRGTVLRVQLAYRHTDYLPVRRDLNLPLSANARDQDGRAIFGTLGKAGALVVPTPGSNRRFSAFDLVSSLDPSAASDYYGVTAALQRMVTRGISLMASYTFSRTTDDWFGARGSSAESQLLPEIDSVGGAAWAEGRSDFDTPHRLVLGTEIRFARAARLAVLYRRSSGAPFTPGFRDGVDVNGDGSGRNDPAFVSDTIVGAAEVVAANKCLRSQVDRFAERNSCREPSVASLDLRLTIGLGFLGRGSELSVDGIGLASSGLDVTDRALYLVDRVAPLITTAGVTRVPLIANPNFGKPLVKRDPGATFRVGIRVAF